MPSKPSWKWRRQNDAYLTAKGESAANPRARVYACYGAPKGSRFRWTVMVAGQGAVAVCTDTLTAMRLGRELS